MDNKAIEDLLSQYKIDDNNNELTVKYFKEDVNNYIQFVKQLEKEILKSSLNPSNSVQTSLNKATNDIVEKGNRLELAINNKRLIKEIKILFRKLILPWLGQSVIMNYALSKPKGYAGDYRILEYVYDDKVESKGMGLYYDQGFLMSDLVASVRNRKDMMREILIKEGLKSESHILNIACGPCREIREIAAPNPKHKLYFTCLDFDGETLTYAKKLMSNRNNPNIATDFVKEDVFNMLKTGKSNLLLDRNIIYSIGLIDYLPDRILIKFISMCFDALKNGGKLILTHKDRGAYNPIREDWLTDWTFIPRDRDNIYKLIKDIVGPSSTITETRDSTNIILFYEIIKR